MKFEIKVTGNSHEKFDFMKLAEEMGQGIGEMLGIKVGHSEYQANLSALLKLFGRGAADNVGGIHKVQLLPDGVVYSCECSPEATEDYCTLFRETGKRFMPLVPMAKALGAQVGVFAEDLGERLGALTEKYTRPDYFGYVMVDKTDALGICGAMLIANDGVSPRICWPINRGNEDYPCILAEAAEKAINEDTVTWLSVDGEPVTDYHQAETLIDEILDAQYRTHSRMAVRIIYGPDHNAEHPSVTVVQVEVYPDGKRCARRQATLAGEPLCPYDLQIRISELEIPEGSTFAVNDERLPSVWASTYADAKGSCGSRLNEQVDIREYDAGPGYKKVMSSGYGQSLKK